MLIVFHSDEEVVAGGYNDWEDAEYDELDFRADDQYWMTDRKIVVEEVSSITETCLPCLWLLSQ